MQVGRGPWDWGGLRSWGVQGRSLRRQGASSLRLGGVSGGGTSGAPWAQRLGVSWDAGSLSKCCSGPPGVLRGVPGPVSGAAPHSQALPASCKVYLTLHPPISLPPTQPGVLSAADWLWQWTWPTSASGKNGPRPRTARRCPWPAPGPAATSLPSPPTCGATTRVRPPACSSRLPNSDRDRLPNSDRDGWVAPCVGSPGHCPLCVLESLAPPGTMS